MIPVLIDRFGWWQDRTAARPGGGEEKSEGRGLSFYLQRCYKRPTAALAITRTFVPLHCKPSTACLGSCHRLFFILCPTPPLLFRRPTTTNSIFSTRTISSCCSTAPPYIQLGRISSSASCWGWLGAGRRVAPAPNPDETTETIETRKRCGVASTLFFWCVVAPPLFCRC